MTFYSARRNIDSMRCCESIYTGVCVSQEVDKIRFMSHEKSDV